MTSEEKPKPIELYPDEEHRLLYGIKTMKAVWKAGKDEKISELVIAHTIKGILGISSYKGKGGKKKATGDFKSPVHYLVAVHDIEGEETWKSIFQMAAHQEGLGYDRFKNDRLAQDDFASQIHVLCSNGVIEKKRDETDQKTYFKINPKAIAQFKEGNLSFKTEMCNDCAVAKKCQNVVPGSAECAELQTGD
jgi:hypothetical protein